MRSLLFIPPPGYASRKPTHNRTRVGILLSAVAMPTVPVLPFSASSIAISEVHPASAVWFQSPADFAEKTNEFFDVRLRRFLKPYLSFVTVIAERIIGRRSNNAIQKVIGDCPRYFKGIAQINLIEFHCYFFWLSIS